LLGEGRELRVVPIDTPPDPSRQLVRIPALGLRGTITITPQTYRYGLEDMFKVGNKSPNDGC
jgi:hypothetical protein